MKSTDEQNTNTDIYLAAVRRNWRDLQFVPEDLRDEKMCMAAIQQNGRALQYVPADLRDEKMCMAAVQKSGWALEFVPKELRDENMCLAAVQQDGKALRYVPKYAVQMVRPDICMAAVQENWGALHYVLEAVKLHHPHICIAAVQKSADALQLVPADVQLTYPAIPLAAVQQDGWALRYVPKSLKTNVEALAKLYKTSEEELRSDLRLLQIHVDVIEEVICSLKAPIATSSSMIEQLLGTGNDSKQHVEHPANSRDLIPEFGVLSIMQEYVYTPPISGNDEKDSDFTPR